MVTGLICFLVELFILVPAALWGGREDAGGGQVDHDGDGPNSRV